MYESSATIQAVKLLSHHTRVCMVGSYMVGSYMVSSYMVSSYMVGSYMEGLTKPQNCQNWWVDACTEWVLAWNNTIILKMLARMVKIPINLKFCYHA